MKKSLITLVLMLAGTSVSAAPQVVLGPPSGNSAITVDPGSIQVFMFDAGEFVNLQVAITIDVLCIRPYDLVLVANGSGGTFSNQSGLIVNGCGGDTSVFDIRLGSDGLTRAFDIDFVDDVSGSTIASIPVVLSPAQAPDVTLGDPAVDTFITVNPGSILIESLAANVPVSLQVELTIHPVCFTPFNIGLNAIGGGGTFSESTGPVMNGCGGETSVFDITLTGDGVEREYVVSFVDLVGNQSLALLPVALYPGDGDADDDGLTNASDNCIDVFNADQRDSDSDRIGNACDPDIALVNDCVVNFADLNSLKQAFFSSPGSSTWNPDADFNGDGRVGFADLAVMRDFFFGPPGPSAGGCN